MSISKSHKITRLELYNEVWSTSILQLSQKYGISDRGLAKLCKRHKIPTPPRGYWAKIESGVKAHKTKLLKPSDNPEIIIRATIKGIKKIQEESVEDLKTEYSYDNDESVEFLLKSLEQESEYEEIVISDNLRGCHKFITRYNELYKKEKEEAKHDRWSNYFHPPTGYGLRNITSFSRAKLILNTIFKEAEKRGYTVAESNRYQGVDLIVHDQKTSIELRDNNHQQLTLEILSWCPNFQSSWSDRKVQRVEHCLNKFFEALIKKAVHEFDRDLTKKKKEEKKEIDRQKIRDLEKENYLTQTGKLDLNAEQELAWAHEQANILDPLNSACSTSEEDSRQKVKALEADILKIKEPYKCFFRGYDI